MKLKFWKRERERLTDEEVLDEIAKLSVETKAEIVPKLEKILREEGILTASPKR